MKVSVHWMNFGDVLNSWQPKTLMIFTMTFLWLIFGLKRPFTYKTYFDWKVYSHIVFLGKFRCCMGCILSKIFTSRIASILISALLLLFPIDTVLTRLYWYKIAHSSNYVSSIPFLIVLNDGMYIFVCVLCVSRNIQCLIYTSDESTYDIPQLNISGTA